MSHPSSSSASASLTMLSRPSSSSSSTSTTSTTRTSSSSSSMMDRRAQAREQRALKRALRSAERAGEHASVALNTLTQVPQIVLDQYAQTPLRDAFWDALVCAEDAPNPPPGVLVRNGVAKRLDSAPAITRPIALPPVFPPTVSAAEFQTPTSAYGMEVWPAFLRSRTTVHCMPTPARRIDGQCVVCWFLSAPRLACNLAFALARHTARALQLPLVGLVLDLPDYADPLCRECEWHGVPVLRVSPGERPDHAILAMNARICFVDEPPTRGHAILVFDTADDFAASADPVCPLVGVCTHSLMPLRCRVNQYADIYALMPDWQAALDHWRANVDWLALPPRRASIDDEVPVEGDLRRLFESAQSKGQLVDAQLRVSWPAAETNSDEIFSVEQWMRSVALGGVDRTLPALRRALGSGRISIYELLESVKVARLEQHPLLNTLGPEFELETLQVCDRWNRVANTTEALIEMALINRTTNRFYV